MVLLVSPCSPLTGAHRVDPKKVDPSSAARKKSKESREPMNGSQGKSATKPCFGTPKMGFMDC